ncbi:hypothetical protein MYX65_00925 [Acidobacteria bacterium AH-259-L09]|nr:hypothetical protein [Acidobacteria bacterium AH-259-L09]
MNSGPRTAHDHCKDWFGELPEAFDHFVESICHLSRHRLLGLQQLGKVANVTAGTKPSAFAVGPDRDRPSPRRRQRRGGGS